MSYLRQRAATLIFQQNDRQMKIRMVKKVYYPQASNATTYNSIAHIWALGMATEFGSFG